MNDLSAVVISGSPAARSRSRGLLDRAASALAASQVEVHRVDLALLPAAALLGREHDAGVDAALAAAARAAIVIAATPVYRATYAGLLKVFFDLMRPDTLAGAVAVGVATGATAEHALVVQHGLAPLFASVGAVVLPAGVYGTDAEFSDGRPAPALLERVDAITTEAITLARALRGEPAHHA